MNNLREEQEKMRLRLSSKADIAKEVEEIEEIKSTTKLVCPYCKVTPTTMTQSTGKLKACKRCYSMQTQAKRHNLTIHQYACMLQEQAGKCAICNELLGTGKAPHIDHCHELNHVRGILCSHCNTMLGFAKDNTEILENACKYLIRNRFKRQWWLQKELNNS